MGQLTGKLGPMKNRKYAIIPFLMLLVFNAGSCAAQNPQDGKITADAAKQILIEKVLFGDARGKIIYISKAPAKKGQPMAAVAQTYFVEAATSAWVFFIDDAPDANWEHPCRYVFLNVNTGEFRVIGGTSPPLDLNLFTKIYP
jgi:hypothetical protein